MKNKRFQKVHRDETNGLDLVKCSNIDGLYKVLKFLDLLGEEVDGHLIVLNYAHDLEFVDSVSNGNKFGSAPQETLHLNGSDGLLQLLHVGLIVPGLDIHDDGRLGDERGLLGLLGGVLGHALLTLCCCVRALSK